MSNKPIKNTPGFIPPPTYKLNPFSNNWVYCPDPMVINPSTGRCVKPDSKTLLKVSYSVQQPTQVSTKKEIQQPTQVSTKKEKNKSKKKETVMQKIIRDYMKQTSNERKSSGKKASSDKSKRRASTKKRAKSI